MRSTETHSDGIHLLYDADRLVDGSSFTFDPQEWSRREAVKGDAQGRGAALFVHYEGEDYVLRHYRRGGLVGPVLGDRYLWTGLARTRAWREWHLLARMREMGLPVPRPLAARVVRSGLIYRADIATARIDAQTLTQFLKAHRPPERFWRAVGATVRRFHAHGIYHADLNAHNVLVDQTGRLYLIDFDRGRLRKPHPTWRTANLERLKRSLDKLARLDSKFEYRPEDWIGVLRGYGIHVAS